MVPGGLPEGRVCRDSLGDGSWTASTRALVSAKVRRKPVWGGERTEVRNKGVGHSQVILTEDLETSLGTYLGHSLGHPGTLALRHKNCTCSWGKSVQREEDATYHGRWQRRVTPRQSDHPIPPFA